MYSQTLCLLMGLSIATATLSQEPSYGPHCPHYPPGSIIISTTTFNETIVLTCPPAPTIWVNVTEYVPVTATTTDTDTETDTTTTSIWNTTTLPITIYQTIISTTIQTTVSQLLNSPIPETSHELSKTTNLVLWDKVQLVLSGRYQPFCRLSRNPATERELTGLDGDRDRNLNHC